MPIMASDKRFGRGAPQGALEMPTNLIPGDCSCSWTVVTPGPGLACKSRRTYGNSLCPHRYDHERDRQAACEAAGVPFKPEVA